MSNLSKLCFACLAVLVQPMNFAHAEESDGFQVAVLGGFTSNSTANLQQDGNLDTLESSDETSAAFGASFTYRLHPFDLGLSVEHMGSGSFQGFNKNRPLGGKVRVATLFSWHYVADHWGSMYFGFSPGLVFVQHSDHLRSQIATKLGRQPTQLDGIDEFNVGFSFGTNFGLIIRVTDSLSILLEGQVLVHDVPLQEESDNLQYLSTQPVLRMGFVAQL